MAHALGEDTILHAGTSSGAVTTPISAIESYSRPSSRSTAFRAFFMQANKSSYPGGREVTLTLNGVRDVSDAGQVILIDAEESGDVAWVKLLPNGTDGRTSAYFVGGRGLDGTSEGPTECSFELSLDGTQAEINGGTGEL